MVWWICVVTDRNGWHGVLRMMQSLSICPMLFFNGRGLPIHSWGSDIVVLSLSVWRRVCLVD